MSVTVNNGPIQDYVHPDDQAELTNEITPGFNLSQFLRHIPLLESIYTQTKQHSFVFIAAQTFDCPGD